MGKISETLDQLRRRLRELLEGIEEGLEGALQPEPELVPVPVRRPKNPQRRR